MVASVASVVGATGGQIALLIAMVLCNDLFATIENRIRFVFANSHLIVAGYWYSNCFIGQLLLSSFVAK